MKRTGMLLLILTFVSSALLAGTIKGLVTEAKTGNPLVGANVYLDGTTFGAATDMDGAYIIEAPDGRYDVVCAYVGYKEEQQSIKLAGELEVNFELKEFQFSQSIVVIADRAKERETPVAFTDVKKAEMEVKLGSQDIPMVLNTTPSVYATVQGGGAGDSRINIRGFNQRNVAVMINGVPMNDMENGWVYWSNWDGLGDATNSIQVQRGLSAINLATPSIGGTMNIITDPSQQEAGFKFKQEIGNDGFIKSTLFGHTGLVNDTWAISAGGVRKVGDGLINSTWTDAWAYYFGAQYNINKNHRLELYAMGAPQRHGQNLYKQNVAAYDTAYAKTLDGEWGYDYTTHNDAFFPKTAFEQFKQQGRKFNQNWAPIDPSLNYNGDQWWDGSTGSRHSSDFINTRENYFHKPLVNLNWYAQLSENFNMYSVLYFSGGKGGGTGDYGAIYRQDADGRVGDDTHKYYYGPGPWTWNLNQTILANRGPAGTYYVDRTPHVKADGQSIGILRNSVNNQWTVGALIKTYYKPAENMTFSFGLDWRTAEIDHFREVRDLLGGQYYVDFSNDFVDSSIVRLGDKVAYNFTNTVDWFGLYAQGEYNEGPVTAYGTLGWSGITYDHLNHFIDDGTGNAVNTETDLISGFQIKGGAAYRLTGELMAFGNLGYVSKVPIFDAVIDDRSGDKIKDPENELFTSFELGADWRALAGQLTLKANFYYTMWQNRTYSVQEEFEDEVTEIEYDGVYIVRDADQDHIGVELELAYQPVRFFRLDLAGSMAVWKHSGNAMTDIKVFDRPDMNESDIPVYIDGLHIGDAPQQQLALALSFFPVQGMLANFSYRYYGYHFADWNPDSRTDPSDTFQSWRTPAYGVMDFHFNYLLPVELSGVEFTLFAHVFNILDEEFIQDAVDNSKYNGFYPSGTSVQSTYGHTANRAEVFMGMPLTFNMGFTVSY